MNMDGILMLAGAILALFMPIKIVLLMIIGGIVIGAVTESVAIMYVGGMGVLVLFFKLLFRKYFG